MNKNATDIEAPDPEDMFNDTRMSFGDHIEELRKHLFRAIKWFTIGMLLSVGVFGQYVLRIIVEPVEKQLQAFEERKLDKEILDSRIRAKQPGFVMPSIRTKIELNKSELLEALGLAPKQKPVLERMIRGFEKDISDLNATSLLDPEVRKDGNLIRLTATIPDAQSLSEKMTKANLDIRRKTVSTMHITEAFLVWLKIAMMTGLVVSSPWVFYEIWMFIAAGLYPHEKKLVHVYMPFSLFLFLLGALTCQFLVIPRAIEAMLWFNEWLGLSADLRLNEWLSFALMMPIVFGLSFQTPLVMMFFNRIGLLTIAMFRSHRKIAWFIMAVFAAVIVPSPDALSMIFMWLPMGALYELGILLCVYQGEPAPYVADEENEEHRNELIEV